MKPCGSGITFGGIVVPILLAAASPALGQDSGRDATPRQFVDAITVQTEGQAPRFHEPVCPFSYGLPADYNRVVAARIRELADETGIAVDADEDCTPNLIVMIADDSEEVMAVLRRTRPDIFTGMRSGEVQRAIEGRGPVRSWQSSEVRMAEADFLPESRDAYLNQDVHLWHGVPASFLRETVRRELRLSVVLFDLAAIDGLSLMQIADHAAMRGLAPTRPAAAAEGRSILALFGDVGAGRATPVAGATNWDEAYLAALYRQNGATREGLQRQAIAGLVERNLARETAAATPDR